MTECKLYTIKCPCGCGNILYIVRSSYFDGIIIGIGNGKERIDKGFLVDRKTLRKINSIFEELTKGNDKNDQM